MKEVQDRPKMNVTVSKKITKDELSKNDDGVKLAGENGTISHYSWFSLYLPFFIEKKITLLVRQSDKVLTRNVFINKESELAKKIIQREEDEAVKLEYNSLLWCVLLNI